MLKKIICLLLSLTLLAGLAPTPASAQEPNMTVAPVDPETGYVEMVTSPQMVDMIKAMEGLSMEPYWDVSQWSVGYGSFCGNDRSKVPDVSTMDLDGDKQFTEADATLLLEKNLKNNYGHKVNQYFRKIGRQPTQAQFDGLVSFTYNLGPSWTSGCRITRWIEEPTTEIELVEAFAAWNKVAGSVSYGHIMRRIREALVFLRGEYYLSQKPEYIQSDLPVVANSDLPYYKCVIFLTEDGVFETRSDTVRIYPVGQPMGRFPTPTREGYALAGWELISENYRNLDTPRPITPEEPILVNLEIKAVWEPLATEPTEETRPDPSDPTGGTTDATEETKPSQPTEPPTEAEVKPLERLPFTDVKQTDWFWGPVEYVYRNGYMKGTEEDRFSPQNSMTRAMLVTVLYRIDGSPEIPEEQKNAFSDTQNDYYTDAVDWAKANGIVMGVTEDRFSPDAYVSRQDAVSIFYRYCVQYLVMDGVEPDSIEGFLDAAQVADYAVDPMRWGVTVGLIRGDPKADGMALNPRGNLTRAEAATILQNLLTTVLRQI